MRGHWRRWPFRRPATLALCSHPKQRHEVGREHAFAATHRIAATHEIATPCAIAAKTAASHVIAASSGIGATRGPWMFHGPLAMPLQMLDPPKTPPERWLKIGNEGKHCSKRGQRYSRSMLLPAFGMRHALSALLCPSLGVNKHMNR